MRRKYHTRKLLVRGIFPGTLTALLLLTLTGCNNNPYPAGETAQSIIYSAISDDPKTLDPSIGYDVASSSIIDNIYPSYMQYNYLKRDPFVVELSLGAEEPKRERVAVTITEDGTTTTTEGERWTFRIKKGLRFQDDPCFPDGKGREILAADFLYTFRRLADPAVPCPIIQYFDDKVLGMAAYRAHNAALLKHQKPSDYTFPIRGLETDPDPYTFHITLSQPYPQLRYLMAMHFTTPLAHEAVERYGKELARHPVGSGAFVLAEYTPKGRIVLVKNPNFRADYYPTEGAPGDREAGLLEAAGQRLPLAEKIQLTIVREGITNWNLFLQGYQDFAGVSQENFQQVMSRAGQLSPEMTQRGLRLHSEVGLDIYYFAFNMDDPTFGGLSEPNRKLRQAISLAIDSQTLIDLLHQGLGQRAESLLPPGLFGYDAHFHNPYRQYDPSLTRAKQLLAEAGYPQGIDPKTGQRLTLFWDNALITPAGRVQIGLIARQIAALGIRLESRAWRYPVFQDRVDTGQFQFMNYGWVADYPDPENFVFLLYGPYKRPAANASNYNNPDYNRLFEQMRAMDDGPERLALIRQMREIAMQDCPWIYINHSESYGLTQPWLKNYKPHPIALDTMKYIGVDGAMRTHLQQKWNQPNYWLLLGIVLLVCLGSLPAVQVVRARHNRHVRRPSAGTV